MIRNSRKKTRNKLNKKVIKRIVKNAFVFGLGITMAISNPLNFLGKSKEITEKKEAIKQATTAKLAKAAENEESEDIDYISDLKIFYDKSEAGCKNKLQGAGYKVVDQDLNDHCGGQYIYMGYKTSKDRGDAITDIRQLHMGTGSEREMPLMT